MRGIVKVVIGGLIVLAIIVIAAVAINLFVSSGGHTTSATSDLRTYTNSQYRFAVSYDADRVTEDTTELPTQGPTPDFVTLLHFTGGYGGVWLIYGLTQRKVDAAYLRGLLRRSVRSYAGYVRLGRIDPAVLGSLPGFETAAPSARTSSTSPSRSAGGTTPTSSRRRPTLPSGARDRRPSSRSCARSTSRDRRP